MRLLLIHWKEAEGEELAAPLRRLGHQVTGHWNPENGAELRQYRDPAPDAIVVSLDRLPSQGVAVATWFRQQAGTRHVPLVFAGGKPEKTEAARRHLPDAIYTGWEGLAKSLKQAARAPVLSPVVPGTMQGYAGVSLSKKLGLKPDCRVALLSAPDEFEKKLESIPPGVILRKQARGEFAVVLQFARSMAGLQRRFAAATRAVAAGGRLWIVWPKRASCIVTDVTQNEVRRFGLDRNWVDFKIAAIDETWSGLAFARRKPSART